MRRRDPNSRPVFSSDGGDLCSDCGELRQDCRCEQRSETPAGPAQVRIGFESKGRGGKAVSLIRGLPLDDEALKALLKELKKACGSGGALKDGVLEIQGDHRAKIEAELKRRGFQPKRSGGS